MTWRNLRQQNAKREGIPNKSLADYIAPKFIDGKPSGIQDYIGMFAVTAGIGADKKEAEYMAALDDYNAIAFKSIADRLAEAFAEALAATLLEQYPAENIRLDIQKPGALEATREVGLRIYRARK